MKQVKWMYVLDVKDKTEEETVKYIYEQIRKLSTDKNHMTKFKQYVSKKLKDDFIVNESENFNGNGVIEISEILCKIMKEE